MRRYVTVSTELVIEVSAESSAFEAAVVWNGCCVIGFGDFVHVVNIETRGMTSVSLDHYFGSFHVLDDALLVPSGDRVRCIAPDGSTKWTSAVVGIDGVLIYSVRDGVVEGEGEWDPPEGWRPFRLSLVTGTAGG